MTLNVPPFVFKSGSKYLIEAELIDAPNTNIVAKANHTLIVGVHELKISMVPLTALIGVGRSIDIEVKIMDLNVEKVEVNVRLEF